MLAYAKVCDGEISGWGKTKVTKKKDSNTYLVTVVDIRIFKQEVTAVHTTLSTDVLTPFYLDLIKEGEELQYWNVWWHSHFDMPVFFSGEDEATIKKTAKGRLYSICINRAGELKARVDEKGKNIVDELGVRIENPINNSLLSACRAEVKRKVKQEVKQEEEVHTRIIPYSGDPMDRFPTSREINWYDRERFIR
jgi:proteasome lid subunit RPN8/RPN11